MLTIDGLVSGIDTQTVVQGLLDIQQRQLDRLELRQGEVRSKQAIFRTLEAQLLTFRADVGRLARSQGNPLSRQTISVSHENAVQATATDQAVAGAYQFRIDAVAKAHQFASQGFVDADSEITQGTLELRVGAGAITTITVDSTNNTLQGLADTINSANGGITASLIQDASNPTTPVRLLLTSGKTGVANAVTVTNGLAPSAGAAVQPTFDLGNPVQAATDAQITLGTGPGAITVASSNNRFDTTFNGITFNVLQAGVGETVTLNVQRDLPGGVEAVKNFVDSYNKIIDFIQEQSRYNAETQVGGPLLGDRSALRVQQTLQSLVSSAVPGLSSQANRLSVIGVKLTDQGKLEFNSNQLEKILRGEVTGVGARDVEKLFALSGESTNSGVKYVLGSARTKVPDSPIQVDITQAATRATIAGSTDLAESTVITSANRTFQISVDGQGAELSLAEGTYTRQELARHLEEVINATPSLGTRQVQVGLTGNALSLTSASYGTSSTLVVTGGTALSDLGIGLGTAGVGKNVAGRFLVDGQEELATGSGRLLSGNSTNPWTADLQVRVSLNQTQVTSGHEAELTLTRGIASQLDGVIEKMIAPNTGDLGIVDDRFDAELESMQVAFDRQKALFEQQRASIVAQFVSVERALSELETTSSFLASQLSALSDLRSNSKK